MASASPTISRLASSERELGDLNHDSVQRSYSDQSGSITDHDLSWPATTYEVSRDCQTLPDRRVIAIVEYLAVHYGTLP